MHCRWFGLSALLIAALALTGCGDGKEGDDTSEAGDGTATGSTCPSTSEITYESFARDFMKSYCTRCHAASLPSSERKGAPSDHNFDTLAGLRATEPEHLDEEAAGGPDAVNTAMPPTLPKPSNEERRKLGEWLACGMP